MTLRLQLPILFALLLVATGCSTPKVHSTRNPQANFTQYKSFALLPATAAGVTLEPDLEKRILLPVQQTVRAALLEKGYTETDLTNADLVVSARGQSLPRVDVTHWGYRRVYAGWGTAVYAPAVDVHQYDERTLMVEAFESRSKQQVWAAWSTRAATGPINVQTLQADLRRLLGGFPSSSPQ